MSNNERCLYQKLVTTRIKLSKCRNRVQKQSLQLKAAKNFMKSSNFIATVNNLPSAAKVLTMLQLREHKKKEKGRRFSTEEKILALAMLKQSPKGYRFLRRMLVLPSQQILIKFLNQANIKPGINNNVFAQLKERANKMKPADKLCVLMFDEMSLKPNVTYNERKDLVIGFVNNGRETKQEFADHAQVFMIRGLIRKYKQPVAYTFSQSATKGPELAVQIKTICRTSPRNWPQCSGYCL